MTEEQLQAVGDYQDHPAFSPLERLVLAYADGLTDTPARVDDSLFAALRAEMDEEQLTELTAAIAWKNYLSRFNRAFQVPEEGLSAR